MPNKTIYIRDEDLPLLDAAQALGGESISAAVTHALRAYVSSEGSRQAAQRSADETASLTRELIAEAIDARAGSLHIDNLRDRGRLRIRRDGALRTLRELPEGQAEDLITQLLALTQVEPDSPRSFPRGRLRFDLGQGDAPIDFHVAATPGLTGRSLTLRRLAEDLRIPDLSEFEPEAEHADELAALARLDHGLVIATGPSGSGKTSTLYALLQRLDREALKVVSVEDPAETIIDGVLQIPVRPSLGESYPEVTRAALRCDPDVLFISEIRDAETARLALQVAATGHLVFTQLHALTAPAAIARLLDLGIEAFLLRDNLRAVIAQRLLRKLCQHCKRPAREAPQSFAGRPLPAGELFEAQGCERCDGEGFRGRLACFEILRPSPALAQRFVEDPAAEAIAAQAAEEGIPTLLEDALSKAARGWLSLGEVARVLAPQAL